MPSLYGALVLTAGLVLLYFGVKDVEQVVGSIQIAGTPGVTTAATEERAVAAKGAGQG